MATHRIRPPPAPRRGVTAPTIRSRSLPSDGSVSRNRPALPGHPLRLPLGLVSPAPGGMADAGTERHEPGRGAHRAAVVQLHPAAAVMGRRERQEHHRLPTHPAYGRPLDPALPGHAPAKRLAVLAALMVVAAANG